MVKFKLFDSVNIEGTPLEKRTAKISEAMDKGRIAAREVTEVLFAGMDPIRL